MTPILNVQNLQLSFATKVLFTDLSFSIFARDRIGLIGPNGSGKSTFLKILARQIEPDSGSVITQKGLIVSYVPQECFFEEKSILEVMTSGSEELSDKILAETLLSQAGFKDFNQLASNLSGGWKKRLSVTLQLMQKPDLLLLDEPTNHLDLDSIIWLENLLKNASFAFLVISHDRAFLQNCTNKIAELNNVFLNSIFSVKADYQTFVMKRRELIEGQIEAENSLRSKVRREEEWLKQNPKARTVKSRSRTQKAYELQSELQLLSSKNDVQQSKISFLYSQRATNKLLVAKNIAKTLNGKLLFEGVNITLSPGFKLAILGPNGSGKTTLLKILALSLTPDSGTLKQADNLKVCYFDQHKSLVDAKKTIRAAISENGQFVNYHGKQIHVHSWCNRFLFPFEKLDMTFDTLSGGEKARLNIALLMKEQIDVLLLDEPTNDLDIETLELLEDALKNFAGALVIISHDRSLLKNVANSFLGISHETKPVIFASFAQWEKNQKINKVETTQPEKEKELIKKVKKLSYKDKKELETIETDIMNLENDIKIQQEKISHINDQAELITQCKILEELNTKLENFYIRWSELESYSE